MLRLAQSCRRLEIKFAGCEGPAVQLGGSRRGLRLVASPGKTFAVNGTAFGLANLQSMTATACWGPCGCTQLLSDDGTIATKKAHMRISPSRSITVS